MVKFGDTLADQESAEAFAQVLSTLKDIGKLDDLLLGELSAGQALKAVAAANFVALAESVAEENGVDVETKFDISNANEDNLSQNTAKAKEFQSGDFVTQVGGNGVGGNAKADFGDTPDGEAASNQFEATLDALESLGELDDFLTGKTSLEDALPEDLSWNALAADNDAFKFKESVGNFNEDNVREDVVGAQGPCERRFLRRDRRPGDRRQRERVLREPGRPRPVRLR